MKRRQPATIDRTLVVTSIYLTTIASIVLVYFLIK